MNANPADLLRLLSSRGARTEAAVAEGVKEVAPASETERAAFGNALARVEGGDLSSGRSVTVERDAGVELSESQLFRLAHAADRAEEAGIHNALVLIDGMALVMEVHSRRVTERADLGSAVLTGIDGVASVPSEDGAGEGGAVRLPAPGMGLTPNAELARLLAKFESEAEDEKETGKR